MRDIIVGTNIIRRRIPRWGRRGDYWFPYCKRCGGRARHDRTMTRPHPDDFYWCEGCGNLCNACKCTIMDSMPESIHAFVMKARRRAGLE